MVYGFPCSRLVALYSVGYFSTYGSVSRALNSSPRAVGGALRHNPFAPIVPCHRVIRSDGKIGGFYGRGNPQSAAVQRKISMLTSEGLAFEGETISQNLLSKRFFSLDDVTLTEAELGDDSLRSLMPIR